jgi:hypothetical protein
MKFHSWTEEDDSKLKIAIRDCQPIFDHYREQGKTYSEANAWDAIAGRLLPDICVTGAACRRRYEKIKEKESSGWEETIEKVEAYERGLAETTFDGVSELLGNVDAIFDAIRDIREEIRELKDLWK